MVFPRVLMLYLANVCWFEEQISLTSRTLRNIASCPRDDPITARLALMVADTTPSSELFQDPSYF